MRFSFNIDLPDKDLRFGIADLTARSTIGMEDRQLKRFFPIIQALEYLSQTNEWQWSRHLLEGTLLTPLYQTSVKRGFRPVKYQAEPPGEEEWLDVVNIYRQGWGDCEDLACARVGELRFFGIAAVPCIKFKRFNHPDGHVMTLIHVMVLWPDGYVEDPSAHLGMKGEYQ